MGKIKVSVHPLFFAFGLYFAFTGKVFSFISFTIVAVIHEIGHSFVAARLGYRLEKITLMPYGCIISGKTQSFSYKDEVKIAFAGPLVNLATVFVFFGLWWVLPESYPFTELAAFSSLAVATINLLPCFPLDGGRILLATLSQKLKRKTALKIVKGLGLALGGVFLALFAYSCFAGVTNISLLFFSAFMLCGNVRVSDECDYVRIFCSLTFAELKTPREVRIIAVGEDVKVRELFRVGNGFFELEIIKKTGKIKRLSLFDVIKLKNEGRIYESVEKEVERLGL